MANLIDMTGRRFGRLIVIRQNNKSRTHGGATWDCKCDCGNIKTIRGDQLRGGIAKSCGCLQKDTARFLMIGNQRAKGNKLLRPGAIMRACLDCGLIFQTWKGTLKQNRGRFCSKPCANNYRSKYLRGSNAARWNGGKSPKNKLIRDSQEYAQWRNNVFERDNHTCQNNSCGKRGCRLHAHHILPFAKFSEHRFDVNNGLTLCLKCHRELHRGEGGHSKVAKLPDSMMRCS